MLLDDILELVTVVSLAVVLAIFLTHLAMPSRRRAETVLDFGTGFSIFIAGWVATELLAIALPIDGSWVSEALHLGVALSFAAWMIIRWRWALRRARVSA